MEFLTSYYALEGGIYAFYEIVNEVPVCKWRGNRVAVAFDSQHLTFYQVGRPEEVMAWATERRRELRQSADNYAADHLAVAFCPTQHDPAELNRLLANPGYVVTFLRKAGLV